jgi:hypothetical protein
MKIKLIMIVTVMMKKHDVCKIPCSYSLKSKLAVRYCLLTEMWEVSKIRVANIASRVSTQNVLRAQYSSRGSWSLIFVVSFEDKLQRAEVCFFEPCVEPERIYLLFLSSN